MLKKETLRRAIPVVLLAFLSFTACKDNPADPQETEKPPLPPLSSMQLDLSFFSGGAAHTGKASGIETPGPNFNNAALRLLVINATVTLAMAVPVATFGAAISQQPVLQSDGKYHWVFSVTENGKTYQADLAGSLDLANAESVWEMRITLPNATPAINNFLWYSGRAKLDNSAGEWHVFDPLQPDAGIEVLHIDWSHPSSEEATLIFTIVKPGIPENGDKLTYSSIDTDRDVVLLDQSSGDSIQIHWDAVTGEGYLIAPNYRNGEKSCWDGQQNDTTCPN